MSNSSTCSWNGLIPNYPDSLQNKFVHWFFRNLDGTSTGVAKFRKDGVLLDSVVFTNDSMPVIYADTFPTGSFDTLQFKVRGTGTDTVQFKVGVFQIRTEIRIDLATQLSELSGVKESFSIFPNPSESFIRFNDFEPLRSKQYQVVDMKGRLIMKGLMHDNQLDISSLTRGLYLLIIPEKQITLRFQKK